MVDRSQQLDELAEYLSTIPGINVAESLARYAEIREAEAEFHAERGDQRQAARHREFGSAARRRLTRMRVEAAIPLVIVVRPAVARPRERRERRHVARATSSSDSGDSDEPDLARSTRLGRAIRARFERVPGSVAVRKVFRP